jgi:hypothetical protein
MTLQNLLGISLDAIKIDPGHITQLLAAADRNMGDAQLQGLSDENRFDAAYKAIMQLSMLALHANGYVQWPAEKVWPLDALRKQRNLADYSGDLVPPSTVAACIENARALRQHVVAWLESNKPDLITIQNQT